MQRLVYVMNPVSMGDVVVHERWAAKLPPFVVPAALAWLPPKLESTLFAGSDHAGWAMNLREPGDYLLAHPRRALRRVERVLQRVSAGGAAVVGISDGLGQVAGMVTMLSASAGLMAVDGYLSRLRSVWPMLKTLFAGTGRSPHLAEVLLLGGHNAAGRVAAFEVSPELGRLTLWGRSRGAERLSQHLRYETGLSAPCTEDPEVFAGVDAVIVASMGTGDLLVPPPADWFPRLRTRTCVVDLCAPYLIDPHTAATRPDVLVVQGSGYELPEEFGWDGSLRDEGEVVSRKAAPPALAESVALSTAGRPELGTAGQEPTLERLKLLGRVLDDQGIVPSQVRSFGAALTPEYLEAFQLPRPRWSCRY